MHGRTLREPAWKMYRALFMRIDLICCVEIKQEHRDVVRVSELHGHGWSLSLAYLTTEIIVKAENKLNISHFLG